MGQWIGLQEPDLGGISTIYWVAVIPQCWALESIPRDPLDNTEEPCWVGERSRVGRSGWETLGNGHLHWENEPSDEYTVKKARYPFQHTRSVPTPQGSWSLGKAVEGLGLNKVYTLRQEKEVSWVLGEQATDFQMSKVKLKGWLTLCHTAKRDRAGTGRSVSWNPAHLLVPHCPMLLAEHQNPIFINSVPTTRSAVLGNFKK